MPLGGVRGTLSGAVRPAALLLLVLAPAPSFAAGAGDAGRSEVCVLSRHSGEVLAGEDFVIDPRAGAPRARELAERVRLEAEAGRAAPPDGVELDQDRVVVLRGPRTSIPPRSRSESAVEVQVFGLVGSDQVDVLCSGRAVRVRGSSVDELPRGWQTLRSALGSGSILCTGGPWQVRVARGKARPYAGIFSFRALPDRTPEPGSTRREARARRGSEVVLRTTLAAYVSGVMAAEHADLDAEAALALAQVVAHDARVERHPGRPLCDTTHCQAFLGTAASSGVVRRALEMPELPTRRWLPYFRGGEEPWELRRPAAEARRVLGDALRFGGDGRGLEVVRASGVEHLGCEPLRAALRLPSCPTEGTFEGDTVRVRGRGRGHGMGLDVEAARRSGLSAPELLRRAYGLP